MIFPLLLLLFSRWKVAVVAATDISVPAMEEWLLLLLLFLTRSGESDLSALIVAVPNLRPHGGVS
jgi:hypothetical protein